MNSSTGFKKRNLLRPASGIINKQKQLLKVFDVGQSQPLINSALKTQISSIQEQINLLDKDKKIRIGESTLQKSYVIVLKKWLKQVQPIIQKQDDDYKIMKCMGVQSYQNGFKKLWKMMVTLDLMISKVTELQIIQLIKYDQMFNTITQDSTKSVTTLNNVSKAGFTPAFFQVTQVLLERNKDLFSFCSDLKKKNPQQAIIKQETGELISQLQSENSKLTTLLEQLQRSSNGQKKVISHQQKTPLNVLSTLKQMQSKYGDKIQKQNDQIKSINEELTNLRIKLGQIKTKLQIAEEEIKNQSFKFDSKSIKAGGYQEALLEEMEKMKKGFEKKIIKITQDFNMKEREMRRKQFDYKSQNQRVKWQKSLLLKKFETLSKLIVNLKNIQEYQKILIDIIFFLQEQKNMQKYPIGSIAFGQCIDCPLWPIKILQIFDQQVKLYLVQFYGDKCRSYLFDHHITPFQQYRRKENKKNKKLNLAIKKAQKDMKKSKDKQISHRKGKVSRKFNQKKVQNQNVKYENQVIYGYQKCLHNFQYWGNQQDQQLQYSKKNNSFKVNQIQQQIKNNVHEICSLSSDENIIVNTNNQKELITDQPESYLKQIQTLKQIEISQNNDLVSLVQKLKQQQGTSKPNEIIQIKQTLEENQIIKQIEISNHQEEQEKKSKFKDQEQLQLQNISKQMLQNFQQKLVYAKSQINDCKYHRLIIKQMMGQQNKEDIQQILKLPQVDYKHILINEIQRSIQQLIQKLLNYKLGIPINLYQVNRNIIAIQWVIQNKRLTDSILINCGILSKLLILLKIHMITSQDGNKILPIRFIILINTKLSSINKNNSKLQIYKKIQSKLIESTN